MLDPKKKAKIIQKFGTHPNDTGSMQVQIAILTEEVKELQKHLQEHRHDFSSRRGLISKVNQRRKLLRYLASEDFDEFEKITSALKLKTAKKIAQMKSESLNLLEEEEGKKEEKEEEEAKPEPVREEQEKEEQE